MPLNGCNQEMRDICSKEDEEDPHHPMDEFLDNMISTSSWSEDEVGIRSHWDYAPSPSVFPGVDVPTSLSKNESLHISNGSETFMVPFQSQMTSELCSLQETFLSENAMLVHTKSAESQLLGPSLHLIKIEGDPTKRYKEGELRRTMSRKAYRNIVEATSACPPSPSENAYNVTGRGLSRRLRARRGQATDPHSIAERLRRERIAERMKVLQELVPNANKTDKASMLDEIIDYIKFLQLQIKVLSLTKLESSVPIDFLPDEISHPLLQEQVVHLMEEDMGPAMQYLQSKGFCLMPLAMACNAISNHNAYSTPAGKK